MTAAQKAARANFKKAVAEAKKIRKKNPKLSQAQAVKQAWAIIKGKRSKVGDFSRSGTKVKDETGAKIFKKPDYKVKRKSSGTFVKWSKVGAVKKSAFKKRVASKKISSHKDTRSHNVNIRVVSGLQGLFDTTIIKDIDALKKQYLKLAKKYHPDAGGTTQQFQQLQKEYESLLKNLLEGSTLNREQKNNEIVIDQAIRDVIDTLINIENINIELIGKWLWISGNTYPVRQQLKNAGLIFIKKEGVPYWVYRGVESFSRGGTAMEEIKKRYGVHEIRPPSTKKLGAIVKINKTKLQRALNKLTKAIKKRPV